MRLGIWYYLFTVCGKLSILAWIGFGCILGYWAIFAIFRSTFADEIDSELTAGQSIAATIKKTAWIAILTALLGVLVPSERSLVMIAGLNYGETAVEKVAESSTTGKAIELLNLKLDKYLEEEKAKQ